MRILIAGRHELAARFLGLAFPAHDLVFVMPSGERACRGASACETAKRLGIPIVEERGGAALASAVLDVQPDVLLSLGYPRIIGQTVLDRVGETANLHFGALPRYRGSWSIPQAMLAGEPAIGVTLHWIAAGIDDGPIICQHMLPDDGTASCGDIYDMAVEVGAAMAVRWLDVLKAGGATEPRAQDEAEATYFPPTYPGDFRIDWRRTLLQVGRYLRASHFPPLPSAFSMLGDRRVAFDWPVELLAGRIAGVACGTIVPLAEDAVGVAVLNGVVVPGTVSTDAGRGDFADLVAERGWMGRRLA